MKSNGIRKWLVAGLALTVAAAAGCAKQSDEFADTESTAIDSSLALGDVPVSGLDKPAEPYQEATPPPATPKPAPAKPKPAAPTTATLDAGTTLNLALQTELTTKTAQVGDAFTATVSSPIVVGNRVVVPEGATVRGHVVSTAQPGKMSGKGMMQLAFDELEFNGKTYNVASVGDTIWGKGGTGKDAAMIGGGVAAGAVLGKVLGGSAAKGAVIGGAAGTAASLMTRGPQLEMPAGTPVAFQLDRDVTVTAPRLTQ